MYCVLVTVQYFRQLWVNVAALEVWTSEEEPGHHLSANHSRHNFSEQRTCIEAAPYIGNVCSSDLEWTHITVNNPT